MCAYTIGEGTLIDAKNLIKEIDKVCLPHIYCTDGNPSYVNAIPKYKTHIASKTETCLVESFNGRLRNFLPCLKRRTLCYAKSINTLKMAMDFFIWGRNKMYKREIKRI